MMSRKDVRLDEYVRPLFEYIDKKETMMGEEGGE